MVLYVRFIVWLAVGLVGLGLVLKIVIDEFFCDWNVLQELRVHASARLTSWFSRLEGRPEDRLMDLERTRSGSVGSMRTIDQKREQLRELATIEQRLQG